MIIQSWTEPETWTFFIITGWDTDQFLTDIGEATLIMLSVVRNVCTTNHANSCEICGDTLCCSVLNKLRSFCFKPCREGLHLEDSTSMLNCQCLLNSILSPPASQSYINIFMLVLQFVLWCVRMCPKPILVWSEWLYDLGYIYRRTLNIKRCQAMEWLHTDSILYGST